MPASDWFPNRQADRRAWYKNFLATVGPIATALHLDATAALSAAAAWIAKDDAFDTAHAAARGASKELQQQAPTSEAATRAFIKQVKAAPGMTPQMLADLRCLGLDTTPTDRADALRPVLDLSLDGGYVVVRFRKHGHQGILLYCRRADEAEWTLLSLDTHSPYVDTRPNLTPGQAEDRHYRAYFADRDQPVGDLSDVASLAVRG